MWLTERKEFLPFLVYFLIILRLRYLYAYIPITTGPIYVKFVLFRSYSGFRDASPAQCFPITSQFDCVTL